MLLLSGEKVERLDWGSTEADGGRIKGGVKAPLRTPGACCRCGGKGGGRVVPEAPGG